MELSPVAADTYESEEMDTLPIQDEDQHMRTLLLRQERRLMDLSREMGVQENLHRLLKQQEQELEESLLERERRLAEAHETISSLQSQRENLQQQLQAMQEQTEKESRKHTNEKLTSSQSPTTDSGIKDKALCSSESGSTDAGGNTERPPHLAPPRMPSVSVMLVDCRAQLGPDGCVKVAQ